MNYYIVVLVFFFFGLPNFLRAQYDQGPTLEIGLDGLVFGRGMIDLEVLSEMIALKQQELTKEVVRRELLNSLGTESFTAQNYAYNVLDAVLFQNNRSVIEREVLEYTSNLAFTMGFSELMCRLSLASLGNPTPAGDTTIRNDTSDIIWLAERFNTRFDRNKPLGTGLAILYLRKNINSATTTSGKVKISQNTPIERYALSDIILDMVYDIGRNNFSAQRRGFYLTPTGMDDEEYHRLNRYKAFLTEVGVDPDVRNRLESLRKKLDEVMTFVFDFYDFVKDTDLLIDRKKTDIDKEMYDQAFDRFQKAILAEPTTATDSIAKKFQRSFKVYTEKKRKHKALSRMVDSLETLLGSRVGANSKDEVIVPDSSVTVDSTVIQIAAALEQAKENLHNASIGEKQSKKEVDALNEHLERGKAVVAHAKDRFGILVQDGRVVQGIAEDILGYMDELVAQKKKLEENAAFVRLYRGIVKVRTLSPRSITMEHANWLQDSLLIDAMQIRGAAGLESPMLSLGIQAMAAAIKVERADQAIEKLESLPNGSIGNEVGVDPRRFVEFIRHMNALDKSTTYGYLFQIMGDMGNVLSGGQANHGFNLLVNNVRKFVIMDGDGEMISVDVEGIIMDLYEHYSQRRKNSVEFLLNIGVGHGAFVNGSSFKLQNGDELNNVSLASERIGLKWKFHNIKRHRSLLTASVSPISLQGTMTKQYVEQPVISDIHLVVYGSGLLYNIVDAKTEARFNSALGGLAVGVSCFNQLDVTIGLAHAFQPMQPISMNNVMYTLGFDVRLPDYLKKVREKRASRLDVKAAEDLQGLKRANAPRSNKNGTTN